jgi:hypothetical protein
MPGKREVSVPELIGQAAEYLRDRGYTESSIDQHRCRWGRFARYAHKRKEQRFSSALAERFVKTLPPDRGRHPAHHYRLGSKNPTF